MSSIGRFDAPEATNSVPAMPVPAGIGQFGIDMEVALPAGRASEHRKRQLVAEQRGAQVDVLVVDVLQAARHDREIVEGAAVLAIGPAVAARPHDGKAAGREDFAGLVLEQLDTDDFQLALLRAGAPKSGGADAERLALKHQWRRARWQALRRRRRAPG